MDKIFISYRRDGGEYLAGRIYDYLSHMGYPVFYDVESLRRGMFNVQLYEKIAESEYVLIVLPPNALDRCVNSDDWFRQEIAKAIELRKIIIPIMMPGFNFPANLPYDIANIVNYQGLVVNNAMFRDQMHKLCEMLGKSPKQKRTFIKRCVMAFLVVCLIAGAGVHHYVNKETPKLKVSVMYVSDIYGDVYFRSSPIEQLSNIVTLLEDGTQVVFLEYADGGFVKIKYNGADGYVKSENISSAAPEKEEEKSGYVVDLEEIAVEYPPDEKPKNTTVVEYKYVSNVPVSMYLRSSPEEIDSNIIGTIPLGTEVGFIEVVNDIFAKIKCGETIGYCKHMYLSDMIVDSEDSVSLTVSNVPDSIYLRSTPDENTEENIIDTIPLGSEVEYLGTPDAIFHKVKWNDKIGYAKSLYLE